METLAYLHIATNYEESTNSSLAEQPYELSIFTDFNWQKLPNLAWINCLSLVLVFIFLSLANNALALQKGQRGTQVRALQSRLKAAGYYKGPITGYYGSLTEAAVKKSQRSKRLRTRGVAGTRTVSKVSRTPSRQRRVVSSVSKTPKLRQRSTQVSQLQNRLKTLGYYNGPVTGYYGPQTRSAVKRFQKARGIVANGVADPKTSTEIKRKTVFL